MLDECLGNINTEMYLMVMDKSAHALTRRGKNRNNFEKRKNCFDHIISKNCMIILYQSCMDYIISKNCMDHIISKL
jgi:hypothetical protein